MQLDPPAKRGTARAQHAPELRLPRRPGITRGFRPPPEVGPGGSHDLDTGVRGFGARFRYARAPVADVALTVDDTFGENSAVEANLDLTSGATVPGLYPGWG